MLTEFLLSFKLGALTYFMPLGFKGVAVDEDGNSVDLDEDLYPSGRPEGTFVRLLSYNGRQNLDSISMDGFGSGRTSRLKPDDVSKDLRNTLKTLLDALEE